MTRYLTRRTALVAGLATALAALALPGASQAQDKPDLRFSAVFSENDIRAGMMEKFGESISDSFTPITSFKFSRILINRK